MKTKYMLEYELVSGNISYLKHEDYSKIEQVRFRVFYLLKSSAKPVKNLRVFRDYIDITDNIIKMMRDE